MKEKKLLLLLLFLSSVCTLKAQQKNVAGQVLEVNDEPLVGVTVMVDGTTHGTITDADGKFALMIDGNQADINLSYVGYLTKKMQVRAGQKSLVIYMQEDAIMLDEAVVIGYGTQKKVNLTGAVATIDNKALENRVSHSISNMLQGAVAGLNVSTSSGVPGSSASINVRGVTSINGASPLVLIDGAVGDINRVNPMDVESVSVIKDASAAAVYGARAAFGVILVTTKKGNEKQGKATVRYSGRMGWEAPTTSTDYESTGYWSVYTVNTFLKASSGNNYVNYNDRDMQQLLARVNDKTEHPDRPWVVTEERNGRNLWLYYGNYDWWHMMYNDNRPVQQHNVSLSGGNKDVKYLVSGSYNYQKGMLKENPDVFRKYNLRSKIDFRINKYATMTNNTSFYASQYTFQGDGSVENTIAYNNAHALACFPMKNPDGSWLYKTPLIANGYGVGNGRHILVGEGSHRNVERNSDFSNTTRLVITPIKQLKLTADFTYRQYQARNTSRSNNLWYREYPDAELTSYATGAGANRLDEAVNTSQYYSANAFANYEDTYAGKHHLSATAGFNYETWRSKNVSGYGENLLSTNLDDLNLVGQNSAGEVITGVAGGQNQYALAGVFARVNYDYKGRYLAEVSGRYDGTSRFASDSRWGVFPSGSIGWRVSEEEFFAPLRSVVDNLKLRGSFGSLGNQNVSSYYTFLRLVSVSNFAGYSFGEGGAMAKYSSLSSPIASDLTWETSQQWDFGADITLFNNRLDITVDGYVRNTLDMLTDGIQLPAVYGATVPQMNTADLRTKGYELSATWHDQFMLGKRPLEYSIGFNLSDYRSHITKYDNKDKTFAKDYYKGMRLGEIWGFEIDGLFQSNEEAAAYAEQVDLSYVNKGLTGGWQAGDVKFVDLDGDGKIGIGANTVDNPGDRKVLGNSLASLQYGIKGSFRWNGIDASVFFQGTGNHYWYPGTENMTFWGPFSRPYCTYMPDDIMDRVWSEDNTDAYFTRPMAYSAYSGPLSKVNNRYLQNLRYLRFKNLTVGYTIPESLTRRAGINQVRFYFSGENLCYWSPLKKNSKYIDPEAAFGRSGRYNNAYYPWSKTYMFGVDVTF